MVCLGLMCLCYQCSLDSSDIYIHSAQCCFNDTTMAPVPLKWPKRIWVKPTDYKTQQNKANHEAYAYFLGLYLPRRPSLIGIGSHYKSETVVRPSYIYSVDCYTRKTASFHDDVIKWKNFPRYWPFVRGIHRSPWIPRTKVSDAELWCFRWSAPE